MPDGSWNDVFKTDLIREAAQSFRGITNGFTTKQLEWSSLMYFNGIADGAKLARDIDLERIVRSWIAGELRPKGWVAAAKSLGIQKGSGDAHTAGRRENGDGASPA